MDFGPLGLLCAPGEDAFGRRDGIAGSLGDALWAWLQAFSVSCRLCVQGRVTPGRRARLWGPAEMIAAATPEQLARPSTNPHTTDALPTIKRALVTGSTAGIGFAIASLFAQEGAAVVVSGRSQERVNDAVKRIQKENGKAELTGVAADLGTAEGVSQLTRQVPAVDILV